MLIYQNIVRKMTTPHLLKVLVPRVIPMKRIAIMKRRPDDEISYIGNKKVLKGTFDNLKKIRVEKIPFDIDGKKMFIR